MHAHHKQKVAYNMNTSFS